MMMMVLEADGDDGLLAISNLDLIPVAVSDDGLIAIVADGPDT
jgi:hypothetical protein